MAEKKSILEEALLDIKNIQSALNANTKEILRSVAKEEIDSVVKESLMSEIYEEEDLDSDDMKKGMDSEKEEMTEGMYEEDKSDDMMEMEMGSEEVAPEMESEMGMNSEELDMEPMDMTSASDDEVLAIYKKLSGDDEIEIVGDEIHLSISEPGDYIVKMGGKSEAEEIESDEMEPEMDDDMEDEMGGEEDGVDYEIEMDDEESTPEDLVPADEDETEEEEEGTEEPIEEKIGVGVGMSVGTHRSKTNGKNIGAPENPKSMNESVAAKKLVSETTKKYNVLLTEATKLKTENEDFRKALKVFRNQLVETVVFNSNLTYTTRLFMEHSTTKTEKQAIIKRFDTEVSNLVESKKLYKTIASELENRKPINESLENKIIKEVTTSSSKQLNESTAYVDPSTRRIKDLINRVENR
jgi:hypothetical protein